MNYIEEVQIMDCRTPEKREQIVKEFNVLPVAHVKLLTGQTKHSDAGQIINDKYYIFHAYPKSGGKEEIIQCGMGAARHFLELIGHEGLPLYNPLHGKGGSVGPGVGTGGQGGRRPREVWNPIAEQLYNAIMWVIVIIDAAPNTKIFDIREKVYRFKSKEPFPSQVKGVNTIIGKILRGKTLTEAIEELRLKNKVRDDMCQFDKLVEIINNYTDKDGNHIEIEPLF